MVISQGSGKRSTELMSDLTLGLMTSFTNPESGELSPSHFWLKRLKTLMFVFLILLSLNLPNVKVLILRRSFFPQYLRLQKGSLEARRPTSNRNQAVLSLGERTVGSSQINLRLMWVPLSLLSNLLLILPSNFEFLSLPSSRITTF